MLCPESHHGSTQLIWCFLESFVLWGPSFWCFLALRKGSNSDLLRMMLESGAGLAAHGRGETLLHAMPERLIRSGGRFVSFCILCIFC